MGGARGENERLEERKIGRLEVPIAIGRKYERLGDWENERLGVRLLSGDD